MSIRITENLYSTLCVTHNATEQEIKKAYRNLALQYHPDKNNNPNAKQDFQKIAAAYEILGDEEKRLIYDIGFLDTETFQLREKERIMQKIAQEEERRAKKAAEEKKRKESRTFETVQKETMEEVEATIKADARERVYLLSSFGDLARAQNAELEKSQGAAAGGVPTFGPPRSEWPRPAGFPEKPKGPLPRRNAADRAATRFPVIPKRE